MIWKQLLRVVSPSNQISSFVISLEDFCCKLMLKVSKMTQRYHFRLFVNAIFMTFDVNIWTVLSSSLLKFCKLNQNKNKICGPEIWLNVIPGNIKGQNLALRCLSSYEIFLKHSPDQKLQCSIRIAFSESIFLGAIRAGANGAGGRGPWIFNSRLAHMN